MSRDFGARAVGLLALLCTLASPPAAPGQPVIVSTVPANMATGVSPTAPVVFTFSTGMNAGLTSATFMDTSTYQPVPTTAAWSAANTVLTCTPVLPFAANHMIVWSVDGEDSLGNPLGGTTAGVFTPGTGDTGCDTNATLLSLTLSKAAMYDQTSSAAPALDTNAPFCFLACLSLPCPRNATNITLQLPTGPVVQMNNTSIRGHLTFLDCGYPTQAALDNAYQNGSYTFTIKAATSNQAVTLNFPSSITQPMPAPHLTNYLAAQAVDPTQPFRLGWEPMSGGTAADCIYVEIYGGVFKTAAPGETGNALNGTATSVVFPANTFQPNHTYSGIVSFYRYQIVTNGNAYMSLIYRATGTEFTLTTTGGSITLLLTNVGWNRSSGFSFQVNCPVGQPLVVETNTDLMPSHWYTWCTTTSTSSCVPFVDPKASAGARVFYRVRTGH